MFYKSDDLTIALNTLFIIDTTYELNTDSDEAYPRQHIPAKVYNDLSVQYDIGGKYQFGFGVNNILNIMPTHMPTIYRDDRIYGVVGRYFFTPITFNY